MSTLTTPAVAQRFWARVRKTETCWLWTGTTSAKGYGQFIHQRRRIYAHRYAYESMVGPIPDGLQLDHVRDRGCMHKNCVNPAHLEPVTCRVNQLRSDSVSGRNARKTHCVHGHEFTPENTYIRNGSWRICRCCTRNSVRAAKRKKRQSRARAYTGQSPP